MKKCPFCSEEIQSEAIKCRFCGEMLTILPTKSAAHSNQVYYVQLRNGLYAWIKASESGEAYHFAQTQYHIEKPVFSSLEKVISDLTALGWAITYRDSKNITLTKVTRSFDALTCIILCLFFVIPAIIYAIATATPKTETLTFPI